MILSLYVYIERERENAYCLPIGYYMALQSLKGPPAEGPGVARPHGLGRGAACIVRATAAAAVGPGAVALGRVAGIR